MQSFKADDSSEENIMHSIFLLKQENQNDSADQLAFYAQNPDRIGFLLNSTLDSDVVCGYKILSILSKKQPSVNFFDIIIQQTESANPLLAESSQQFLIELFNNHPQTAKIYHDQITNSDEDFQPYFRIINSPFVSTTSQFLISLFKSNNFLRASEFTAHFFNTFFEIIKTVDPIQFYMRLKFLNQYLIFDDAIDIVYEMAGRFIIENFQNFAKNIKDRDFLKLFLSVVSRCANGKDETWMIEFLERNYVDLLFSLYSTGDDDINIRIITIIIGFTSLSSNIVTKLNSCSLFEFFGAHFRLIEDFRLQKYFIQASYNLFCYKKVCETFIDPFLNSQFFIDILTICSEVSLSVKAEIIRLLAKLITVVGAPFLPILHEYSIMPIFVNALSSIDSMDEIQEPLFRIFEKIAAIYKNTNDENAQALLTDDELVEFYDDYIGNADPSDEFLVMALNIKDVLYEVNDCAD